MNQTKPIKRHPALIELSRDHHFGLLLCWKIRTGFKKGIDPGRIENYVQYSFDTHILDHFDWEENIVFPFLDKGNELRIKAQSQHNKLRKLLQELKRNPEKREIILGQIEENLEKHIRFEERELFNFVQDTLSEKELDVIEKELEKDHHGFKDDWSDVFWN